MIAAFVLWLVCRAWMVTCTCFALDRTPITVPLTNGPKMVLAARVDRRRSRRAFSLTHFLAECMLQACLITAVVHQLFLMGALSLCGCLQLRKLWRPLRRVVPHRGLCPDGQVSMRPRDYKRSGQQRAFAARSFRVSKTFTFIHN